MKRNEIQIKKGERVRQVRRVKKKRKDKKEKKVLDNNDIKP